MQAGTIHDRSLCALSRELCRRRLRHRLILPKRRWCARRGRSRSSACASRSGETSWHGFTGAIVEGLRARGVALAVEQIIPIRTDEYPTPAKRPRNSRLDLDRLRLVFGIVPVSWQCALAQQLDKLAQEPPPTGR
jgi:dTDP-4-dehydrorhamnose reductase